MGGTVVRAQRGHRDQYRPIQTPLSPTSDPIDITRALLTLHPFGQLYVADLDAIMRRGNNHTALERLKAAFPELCLWVDNGVGDFGEASAWLDAGLGHLVLGSESQYDGDLLRGLADNSRIILSLDFRGTAFQGPRELLDATAWWPERIIVMTLERVGSGAGPDFERVRSIERLADRRSLYAAGGVRDIADLWSLAEFGVAGALVASCLHDCRLTGPDLARLAARSPGKK